MMAFSDFLEHVPLQVTLYADDIRALTPASRDMIDVTTFGEQTTYVGGLITGPTVELSEDAHKRIAEAFIEALRRDQDAVIVKGRRDEALAAVRRAINLDGEL
jgi:hypothetical protein